MWSYAHTEDSPEKLKELFRKQSEANPKTFPDSVLKVVDAAIDALPSREPTEFVPNVSSDPNRPTVGSREYHDSIDDDGYRIQARTDGDFSKENPELARINVSVSYVKITL